MHSPLESNFWWTDWFVQAANSSWEWLNVLLSDDRKKQYLSFHSKPSSSNYLHSHPLTRMGRMWNVSFQTKWLHQFIIQYSGSFLAVSVTSYWLKFCVTSFWTFTVSLCWLVHYQLLAGRSSSILWRIKTYTKSILVSEHFSDLAIQWEDFSLARFYHAHPRRIFILPLLETVYTICCPNVLILWMGFATEWAWSVFTLISIHSLHL